MIRVGPAFYGRFSCIASRCKHSCCVGWEIDVDEESKARYKAIPGMFGEELRNSIGEEPAPHFILRDGERCPFLRTDGLCRIILTLGEDALCEICREHPRFYNLFPGREERGLGLCCEEFVRLLLNEERFSLIEEDDKDCSDADPWRETLAALRKEIFSITGERDLPFRERLIRAFDLLQLSPPCFDRKSWVSFFLSLERMDEDWTKLMKKLLREASFDIESQLEVPRYEKLFCYLVYRHFITAEDEEEAKDLLFFCAVGTILIAALDLAEPENGSEHIRLFSAEIEYSSENVGKICEMRGQSFDFGKRI